MSASAPFPGESSYEEIANPRQAHFVVVDNKERGMIPSFYIPHGNPEEITVTMNGVPLLAEVSGRPFTVAEIPIERRWAVRADGEILDGMKFRDMFIRHYQEYFSELGRRNPDNPTPDGGKADLNIKSVDRFVSVMVDPANPSQFVPMHYDSNVTAGAKPDKFYKRDGEEVEGSRISVLCSSYADPLTRKRMTADEIAEVEAHLGMAGGKVSGSEIATKLEVLNGLLTEGLLSAEQHSQKVAALTGATPDADFPAPEPAPDPEPAPVVDLPTPPEPPPLPLAAEEKQEFTREAKCGKAFTKKSDDRAVMAVRTHSRNCMICDSELPDWVKDL
jgi:hypothetical protein